MAKSEHCGGRSPKGRKIATRPLALGYYYILTDTDETEKRYLEGLRNTIAKNLSGKIEIAVHKAHTARLVSQCQEAVQRKSQYSDPWIVFDRDRVTDFDKLIQEAESVNIRVGWSNPCIEIFFFAYYGEMPSIYESRQCYKRFEELYLRKTGQEYTKANSDLFSQLRKTGNEQQALSRAVARRKQHIRDGESTPSKMCPSTTLDILVSEILSKVE